jgi:hypothetical protein
VPKCAFRLKNFFSRTKSGAEKLKVLYLVYEQHLLRAYTFAVASRLLRYIKLKI